MSDIQGCRVWWRRSGISRDSKSKVRSSNFGQLEIVKGEVIGVLSWPSNEATFKIEPWHSAQDLEKAVLLLFALVEQ
jgi:hypothetical protein